MRCDDDGDGAVELERRKERREMKRDCLREEDDIDGYEFPVAYFFDLSSTGMG